MAGVVEVPVAVQQPPLRLHPPKERRARVGREDVEGGGLDALSTAHSTVRSKTAASSSSMPKTKLPLTMTPEAVQAPDGLAVVAAEVLGLALRAQAVGAEGLEADEEAAQAAGHGLFEQPGRSTEATVPAACQSRPMPRMAVEEGRGEARVAEEMVVEEVEVPAGQARDLGEGASTRCV